MTKGKRLIVLHIAVGVVMVCTGLIGLDRAIAEYLRTAGLEDLHIFLRGTDWLDVATGKSVSKFLAGLILIGSALALLISDKARSLGRKLLFIGSVQLSATLLTGVSKNVFGRLRPFELLQSRDWDHEWFLSGSAFPSGHTGFYFGLFMPLAYLFPQFRWPLLLAPWFIAVARIIANDHFMSDVAASIALTGLLTLILARMIVHRSPLHSERALIS